MKIYAQRITEEMYRQQEPDRLDKLTEHQFHNLLILPERMAGVALRLMVWPESIGSDSDNNLRFGLRYTDRDLRPVNPKLHMARLIDRYWQPDIALPITSSDKHTRSSQGFFTPYEPDFDDQFLLFCISQERQRIDSV